MPASLQSSKLQRALRELKQLNEEIDSYLADMRAQEQREGELRRELISYLTGTIFDPPMPRGISDEARRILERNAREEDSPLRDYYDSPLKRQGNQPLSPEDMPRLPRAISDPGPISDEPPPPSDKSPAEIAAGLKLPEDNRNYYAPIPADDENAQMMLDGLDVIVPGAGKGVKALRKTLGHADEAADAAKIGRRMLESGSDQARQSFAKKASNKAGAKIDNGLENLDDAAKAKKPAAAAESAQGKPAVTATAAPNAPEKPAGSLYDVGLAKDLRKQPVADTHIHHVPQSRQAESVVGDFNTKNKVGNEPAMRLSREEHEAITEAQRQRTAPASARDLLADDVRLVRKHTDAPNAKVRELIEQNKLRHPSDYEPLQRLRDAR